MVQGEDFAKAEEQRARQLRELERKYAAPRRTKALISWLVFLVALAIAGAVVYYAFFNREQFSRLWYRATHPASEPVEVQPDQ
jgi:cytoskeletal protein RodZ